MHEVWMGAITWWDSLDSRVAAAYIATTGVLASAIASYVASLRSAGKQAKIKAKFERIAKETSLLLQDIIDIRAIKTKMVADTVYVAGGPSSMAALKLQSEASKAISQIWQKRFYIFDIEGIDSYFGSSDDVVSTEVYAEKLIDALTHAVERNREEMGIRKIHLPRVKWLTKLFT